MDEKQYATSINQYYGKSDSLASIYRALEAAGKDPNNITYSDLSEVDQFHIGGEAATQEMARMAGLYEGQTVLDVGGGLGGPARILASEFGCKVTVLDLTEEFCRVGESLTERVGLKDQVTFKVSNALDMPFADESFDAAWTQHSTMNIEDKEQLYAEIHRILRPGGRLVMHEIMSGPQQPVQFPVPWAETEEISFLRSPEEVRSLIAQTGFREVRWVDVTGQAIDWSKERAAKAAAMGGPPTLGLHLLLGPKIGPAVASLGHNLQEGRLTVIMTAFDKA